MLNYYMIILWIGTVAIEKSYQWKSQWLKTGDKRGHLNAEICKQTSFERNKLSPGFFTLTLLHGYLYFSV